MIGKFKTIKLLAAGFASLIAITACKPEPDYSKPPGQFRLFYQITIELLFDKKTRMTLEYVVGCRTEDPGDLDHVGNGAYKRVPRVFGIAAPTGEGVLTHSPDICARDIEEVVPDDFMPLMFHSKDADDVNLLTAYLSEMAFEQKASRMTFIKATVVELKEGGAEAFAASNARNIVPQIDGPWWWELFNRSYWHWDDPRYDPDPAKNPRQVGWFYCDAAHRLPVREEYLQRVRSLWPEDKPEYWVLWDRELKTDLQSENSFIQWEPFNEGIMRQNGGGRIALTDRPVTIESYGPKAPWYRDDYYPKPIPDEPIKRIATYIDLKDGLDQGFGYCYRSNYPRRGPPRGARVDFKFADDAVYQFYLNGKLLGEIPLDQDRPRSQEGLLMQRDEFAFSDRAGFPLNEPSASMR